MYMLKFLLAHYARPFYKALGVAAALGALAALGAYFTAYFEPVVLGLGALAGVLAAAAATLAVLVLNAALAAGLARRFEHFASAYDAYRRANGIPDPFYEELDLAEAAEREAARGNA